MKRALVWGLLSLAFGALALGMSFGGSFAGGFALASGLFGLTAGFDHGGKGGDDD